MRRTLFLLLIAAVLGLAHPLHSQQEVKPARIRAVLHDPHRANPRLFLIDQSEAVVPLEFKPHDLSEAMLVPPTNGSLVLFDRADIDPENPAASVAASVPLPADLKSAILIVLAAPTGSTPACRLLLIDDSDNAFPGGESRAISLIKRETAIMAGEHRIPIEPGKITRIPMVRKVDDFHMGQTNFYYRHEESWVPFAERQLQYLDASRRLFILHATPGALHPTVTTIVDTLTPANPR